MEAVAADMLQLQPSSATQGYPVPELCRFAGIVVIIHNNDHNPPHFHVRYQGQEVLIEIQTLRVYAGSLPRRQLSEVQKWATDHQEGLMRNWDLAMRGEASERLAPPQ